jgi:hypothetical protein
MSATSQTFLPIDDIRKDLVFLKDGSVAVVLQTGAVNFDLLSDREQLSIIDTFAGLLNSLSFSIQIVIRSKRLDISNYLELLKGAEKNQTNPLLRQMMERYRAFISRTIKENEVLDKQFYIVIQASYLEMGMIKSSATKDPKKALTILIPRRDHMIRQFGRIGLKLTQLNTEKLINLFYDIYNQTSDAMVLPAATQQGQAAATPPSNPLAPPQSPSTGIFTPLPIQAPVPTPSQIQATPTPQQALPPQPVGPPPGQLFVAPNQQQPPPMQQPSIQRNQNLPFVVEELHDDFHRA